MPFINNVDWAEFLDCAKLEARVRWWRRLCPPHIADLRDRPVQPTQGATLGAFRSVARSLILHDASPPVRRVAEQPHAQGLDPLAEIAVTLCSPDTRLMRNKTSSELIDLAPCGCNGQPSAFSSRIMPAPWRTFGLPSSTRAGQVPIRSRSSTSPPSSQLQSARHPEG